ncbi:hypothetical protein Scep_024594 [Stephania cephalantha]|uniref:Protein CHUP1, chloroplastic n=1 Tax=Stephania cephalantha TaxID=152367 RepID=A0AAP0EXI7_9MAGN
MKPVLLRLGVALALSFAGFFYSHLRTRRIRPRSPGDCTSPRQEIVSGGVALIHEENDEDARNLSVDFSFSKNHPGEEEGLLLPEFNNLVFEEFGNTAPDTKMVPPAREVEPTMSFAKTADRDKEEEILKLRNMVQVLQERERNLESQLLEYYGLKEQESTVKELQNRLKASAMETKLLNLRIESLKVDKQKLEAKLADHSKVASELESAQAKIKLLTKKIKSDEEHAKKHLASLQQSVAKLQNLEQATATDDVNDQKIQLNLQKMMELETKMEELTRENSRLVQEKSELTRRLESAQNLAASRLDPQEAQAKQEANERLRQENDDLNKEIERLQANRCADVEELVYLKWINACLRYELRNYQAPAGKTVAKDLSKTLSPRSEEKAKQLILEYANTDQGRADRSSLLDFDYDNWSSSQDSNLTESGDFDDSSFDFSSASRTHSTSKSKFLSKLRKLVFGKDGRKNDRASSVDRTPGYATSRREESVSAGSFEEMMGTHFHDTPSSHHNSAVSPTDLSGIEARMDERRKTLDFAYAPQNIYRGSLDIPRPRHLSLEDINMVTPIRRNSDVGSLRYYRTMVLKEGNVDDNLHDNSIDAAEKSELAKYAMALRGSHGNAGSHKRSVSYI